MQRAVDFIFAYIEEKGYTQSEAAEIVGWSRQNFWDKLNNRNPRFNTMIKILKAFGFDTHIVRKDGTEIDFEESDFMAEMEKENLPWDSVANIFESMGYELAYEQRQ